MTRGLPVGWSVELPDPSVGIFGEPEFYHDACPATNVRDPEFDDPTPADAVQGDAALTLTCQDCGAVEVLEGVYTTA